MTTVNLYTSMKRSPDRKNPEHPITKDTLPKGELIVLWCKHCAATADILDRAFKMHSRDYKAQARIGTELREERERFEREAGTVIARVSHKHMFDWEKKFLTFSIKPTSQTTGVISVRFFFDDPLKAQIL